jgi:hypothetical protein
MATQKPENKLTGKVLSALHAEGAHAFKIHGNIYSRGISDILCCYRGQFVALEVKLPGKQKTLTALQRQFLLGVRKAQGKGYMITTVDAAIKVLRRIDKELDA